VRLRQETPMSSMVHLMLIIVPLLGFTISCKRERAQEHPEIYPLVTPAWGEFGALYLRRESDDPNVLLLRHFNSKEDIYFRRGKSPPEQEVKEPKPVYRFNARTNNLEPVAPTAWAAATGAVVDCFDGHQAGAIRGIDSKTLSLNDQRVPTAGTVVLDWALSPDKQRLAILSADGPWHESMIPFIGGGYAEGMRYHEVFRRSDGAREGMALKLAGTDEKELYFDCWSADGRYLIWADSYFARLWIIEVPPDEVVNDHP